MASQYFSFKNSYPELGYPRPDRIRLPDGTTKTWNGESYTLKDLIAAGYRYVMNPPNYDPNRQILTYEVIGEAIGSMNQEMQGPLVNLDGTINDPSAKTIIYGWKVTDISLEEKSLNVRQQRNQLIEDVMWRVYRYHRETRLGLSPTDDILKLDRYILELCEVPNQEGFPWNVEWPVLEE